MAALSTGSKMLYVRPGRLADLDALQRMARTAQPVLHSLPHDRPALEARLALSDASFRASVDAPGEQFYLFVLEDAASGALLGTASIVAAAGHAEPFWVFRNDALIHASRELQVHRKIHALTISHELTGKSRLAGFYIDPSVRDTSAAWLLSRARMMFVAAQRQRFTPEVFALLLGVTDAHGVSPFWEALGRKFFGRDFADIDIASGGRSRTFIAEVMPTYPVYVPLLPQAAQRVLGEPNESALLAYAIHREEGFETDRFVDIFDAGPVLTAQVDRSACVTDNEMRTVSARPDAIDASNQAAYLVAHGADGAAADAFRCVLNELPDAGSQAPLSPAACDALGVAHGDTVRCVPLHRTRQARSTGDAR